MKIRQLTSKTIILRIFCSLGVLCFATTVWARTAPKELFVGPPHPKSNPSLVSPPSGSVPREQSLNGSNPHGRDLPDAALLRQMLLLDRTKHLLELSSVNEPAGHKAVAARHLESAINELKMEMREHAKAKHAEQANAAPTTPNRHR